VLIFNYLALLVVNSYNILYDVINVIYMQKNNKKQTIKFDIYRKDWIFSNRMLYYFKIRTVKIIQDSANSYLDVLFKVHALVSYRSFRFR